MVFSSRDRESRSVRLGSLRCGVSDALVMTTERAPEQEAGEKGEEERRLGGGDEKSQRRER
jgi:hypothetical protein